MILFHRHLAIAVHLSNIVLSRSSTGGKVSNKRRRITWAAVVRQPLLLLQEKGV
jgi:hypothetical protein